MIIKEYYEDTATPQQVYDFVIGKLREQGVPSIDVEGRCRYLYGGLKCGIGQLIPDGKYLPEMDNLNKELLLGFLNSEDSSITIVSAPDEDLDWEMGNEYEDENYIPAPGGPWPMFRSLVDGEVSGIEAKETFLKAMQLNLHDAWALPAHSSPRLPLLEGLERAAEYFCKHGAYCGIRVQYTPPGA